ncbi:MAG: TrkA family potassium uptake protein [Bdellovibrionota bacterium]
MSKQVLVVGLGQFGLGLVRALSQSDVEIIAVDSDKRQVDIASSWVSKAVCFDATDEEALAQLHPERRDVCICATGDQSKEVGIICTALFKQFGAKRIIARANDDLHSRILKLVGADEVVNPEWDFGERFAPRILSENVLGEMLLGSDLVISEIKATESLWNRTLADLRLQTKYGITVIAVRDKNTGQINNVGPDYMIAEGDIIVSAAKRGSVQKLLGEG